MKVNRKLLAYRSVRTNKLYCVQHSSKVQSIMSKVYLDNIRKIDNRVCFFVEGGKGCSKRLY